MRGGRGPASEHSPPRTPLHLWHPSPVSHPSPNTPSLAASSLTVLGTTLISTLPPRSHTHMAMVPHRNPAPTFHTSQSPPTSPLQRLLRGWLQLSQTQVYAAAVPPTAVPLVPTGSQGLGLASAGAPGPALNSRFPSTWELQGPGEHPEPPSSQQGPGWGRLQTHMANAAIIRALFNANLLH